MEPSDNSASVPSSILNSLSSRLSSYPPLLYLLVYISLIPLFAIAYTFIPKGFYAPYARMENSGIEDAKEIQDIFGRALIRKLRKVENSPDAASQPLHWYIDYLGVSDLASNNSESIKFNVFCILNDREHPDEKQLIYFGEEAKADEYALTTDPEGHVEGGFSWDLHVSSASRPIFKKYELSGRSLEKVIRDASDVDLTSTEFNRINMFMAGIAGNAVSISGSYSRMLYFSSIVITTVGFGDIIPIAPTSRLLVAMEALLGIILAGLFLNALAFRASNSIVLGSNNFHLAKKSSENDQDI